MVSYKSIEKSIKKCANQFNTHQLTMDNSSKSVKRSNNSMDFLKQQTNYKSSLNYILLLIILTIFRSAFKTTGKLILIGVVE